MLSNARTAMKFFVYGLILGLLFAPRSGAETRKEVMSWVSETVQDMVKTVSGGGNGPGAASQTGDAGGDTQPMTSEG